MRGIILSRLVGGRQRPQHDAGHRQRLELYPATHHGVVRCEQRQVRVGLLKPHELRAVACRDFPASETPLFSGQTPREERTEDPMYPHFGQARNERAHAHSYANTGLVETPIHLQEKNHSQPGQKLDLLRSTPEGSRWFSVAQGNPWLRRPPWKPAGGSSYSTMSGALTICSTAVGGGCLPLPQAIASDSGPSALPKLWGSKPPTCKYGRKENLDPGIAADIGRRRPRRQTCLGRRRCGAAPR